MADQLTDADVGRHFMELFHLAQRHKIKLSDIGKRLEYFVETFGIPLEKGNVGVQITEEKEIDG